MQPDSRTETTRSHAHTLITERARRTEPEFDLDAWMIQQRLEGASFQLIADQIRERTDVRITAQTIREWIITATEERA